MKNYLIQFLTKGPCHRLGVVVLLLPFINRADEPIRQTTGESVSSAAGHDGLLDKLLQIDVGGSFYNLIKSL